MKSDSPRETEGVREMLDFLAANSPYISHAVSGTEPVLWAPAADVYELDGRLYVLLEIAGMKSKDFRIQVKEGVLAVQGERRPPHHLKDRKYHAMEWYAGPFEKRVPLPDGFNLKEPASRYVDGVLEISFPARNEGKGS